MPPSALNESEMTPTVTPAPFTAAVLRATGPFIRRSPSEVTLPGPTPKTRGRSTGVTERVIPSRATSGARAAGSQPETMCWLGSVLSAVICMPCCSSAVRASSVGPLTYTSTSTRPAGVICRALSVAPGAGPGCGSRACAAS